MAVKIYFKNQIHRFNNLPQNLQALLTQVVSLFKEQLPASWSVQYIDSDGDHITVSHEDSYKELVEEESSSPKSTLKLYIVPLEEQVGSNVKVSLNQPAKYPLFEDELQIQKEKENIYSQNQGEKAASADYLQVNNDQHQLQAVVIQSQVIPQPKIEEIKNKNKYEGGNNFAKARKLLTILVKGKNPEANKEQMQTELSILRETLTQEQNEKLEAMKKKLEEKHQEGRKEIKKKSKELSGDQPKEKKEKKVKSFRPLKFINTIIKVLKTQRKGEAEDIYKQKEKLFKMIPEQGKEICESILNSLSLDSEKETLKSELMTGVRKLVEQYFPEDKEKILQEIQEMEDKRRKKLEEKMEKLLKQRAEKTEERKKKLERVQQERVEIKAKFPQEVFKKAKILTLIFPQEQLEKLCDYVKQQPEVSTMKDLVINFH